MGSVMESVKADKYTFQETENGLEILRHGEPWISAAEFPTIAGCNATLALFHEVLQLRAKLASVPQRAADVLADVNREAPALLRFSVPATEELLDHPHLVCGAKPDGNYSLRLLGVVNGVLSAAGLPKLTAKASDDLDAFFTFSVGKEKPGA